MYLASSEKCNALFHLFVFIVYITRSHLHAFERPIEKLPFLLYTDY